MSQEQKVETAQERFNTVYVTSTEICQRLNVTRASILHARGRGLLPDPIVVPPVNFFLWERTTVEPYIAAWEINLKAKRGQLA